LVEDDVTRGIRDEDLDEVVVAVERRGKGDQVSGAHVAGALARGTRAGSAADPPPGYVTRTYRWSSRYALEKSPSLKRRNGTFHRPASLIRSALGWVPFRPSARVTLNVDHVVWLTSPFVQFL